MSYTFQGARPEAVHYTGHNQVTDQGHGETEDQTNNNSGTEPCFNEFSVNMDHLELISCRSAEPQSRAGSDIHCDVYLIEKWFEACDPRGLGKVKVSALVDYLRTSIDVNLQVSFKPLFFISIFAIGPSYKNSFFFYFKCDYVKQTRML